MLKVTHASTMVWFSVHLYIIVMGMLDHAPKSNDTIIKEYAVGFSSKLYLAFRLSLRYVGVIQPMVGYV